MKILRWIAVIPAFFVAYAVVNLVQALFAGEWIPADVLDYLRANPDFGLYETVAACALLH